MKTTLRCIMAFFAAGALPTWATGAFPMAIQEKLSLTAEPGQSCGVCHLNSQTSQGTVTTPFGVSMRTAGLLPYDTTSLNTALDTLERNATDSDADGAPDITELRNGTNPNVADVETNENGNGETNEAGNGAAESPPPRYGCGANVIPQSGGLLGLAFVLWLRQRTKILHR